jgi:hypothetical protein
MRLVWGTVTGMIEESRDVQRVSVALEDASAGQAPVVVYPTLSGRVAPGDRVLVNTTAVDLGLGTGGEHFCVARAGEGVALEHASPGHIMKLRYTPLQHDVVAAEEPAGAHDALREARSIDGMPVVCCGLHSQVPLVAAAAKERRPELRIAYVMTDGAALPLAVSHLVPRAVAAGLIDDTITCGQAFGGSLEAVNAYSGLLASRHVARADIAVVGIGPGIPGTATPFGHGGVAQGEALNAVSVLGGVPIAVLRVSFADSRSRHVPVSHQTVTALHDVALRPVLVPVPQLAGDQAAGLEAALEAAGLWERHEMRRVEAHLPDLRGIDVSSMGRSFADDPAFFLAAAAGGLLAAESVPDHG